MVQPGASPATYEPKPAQMVALAAANLYFSIGVPFENVWLKRISAANPEMKVIPTDHGIVKRSMADHDHETSENHGANGDDIHPGRHDPHIWTSPPLVMMQARTILTALQSADPQNHHFYETNYKNFIIELLDLDADIRAALSSKQGAAFLVFHPSWGYFANTYGLHQVAIEVEGKAPKPALLDALIHRAKKEKISIVFVQPQFSSKTADLIAKAIDGQVIPADPLAENWADNLRNQAILFRDAISKGTYE